MMSKQVIVSSTEDVAYIDAGDKGGKGMSDEELILSMMAGSQSAFETIIHRYHAPLYYFLERRLRDENRAEDFVQETFIKLIRQLKKGNPPEKVKSWLFQVAINLCRDYWRSAGYRSESYHLEQVPERPDQGPSVVTIFERLETRKEILSALQDLSEIQKEIVLLRFYQELKYQEIADVLDMPIGTVKSTLFHALRKLKSKIKPELLGERKRGSVDE